MDSNYKNIKKLLSEEHTDIPAELDWDKMQGGIMNSLKEMESESKSKRKHKSIRRIIYYSGLVFLLALSPFVCKHYDLYPNTALNTNQSLMESLPEEEIGSDKASRSQNTNTDTDLLDKKSDLAITSDIISSNKKIVKEQSNSKQISNLKNSFTNEEGTQKQKTTNNTQLHNSNHSVSDVNISVEKILKISESKIDQSIVDSNQNLVANKSKIETVIDKNATEDRINDNNLFEIATLGNITFNIEYDFKPSFNSDIQIQKLKDKKPSTSRNRIFLTSGITTWNMGFGQNKPEREPFEKNIISFNSQLNYVHAFNNDYILMVGFQYQQLESRFNWSELVDDHEVLLEDVVKEIQQNSFTGDQKLIIGDTIVKVDANRTVQQYNRAQLLQLPIAIGKTWSFGKWQADLLLGGSLNIYSNNNGTSLFQNTVQNYSGSSNDFVKNRWSINSLASTRFSYNINDNLGISSGIQFQKSISNWSTESEVSMRPYLFNLELGLVLSL